MVAIGLISHFYLGVFTTIESTLKILMSFENLFSLSDGILEMDSLC